MHPEWQAIMMADKICGESAYRSEPASPSITASQGQPVRQTAGKLRMVLGSALVRAGEWLRGTSQEVAVG